MRLKFLANAVDSGVTRAQLGARRAALALRAAVAPTQCADVTADVIVGTAVIRPRGWRSSL